MEGCPGGDPCLESEVCSLLSSSSPRASEPDLGSMCFSPVFTGVSHSADSGEGGGHGMALNNTESHSKKVPLPLSCAPVDYSWRKSLFPANMSLTPL